MNRDQLVEQMQDLVAPGLSLGRVDLTLREYRKAGVSRCEARDALDALRVRAEDEASEDRILEVLDIVTGFCPPERDVWDS